jgi:hypothetical protein
VTSGACPPTVTDTVSITIHPRPVIPTPQTIEICSGDFFEFEPVNGGEFVIPVETVF